MIVYPTYGMTIQNDRLDLHDDLHDDDGAVKELNTLPNYFARA